MFRAVLILLVSTAMYGQNNVSPQGGHPSAQSSVPVGVAGSTRSSQGVSKANHAKADLDVSPSDTVMTIHGLCSNVGIMAHVNVDSCTTEITREQFDTFVEALRASGERMPQQVTPELRRSIAQIYLETFTFEEAGRKAGLEKDARFVAAMKGMRMMLLSKMYQHKMDEDARHSTDSEIASYYKQNLASFEQLELAHIVFPSNNPMNLQDKDFQNKAEQLAQELRDRLAKGEDADKLEKEGFETLGQKSPPTTKLGPARRGEYSPDQEKQLFALKMGEVTPVIKLPSVYVAYKLISRRTIPLDEAKNEILMKLANEKVERETNAMKDSVRADYDTRYFGPPPRAVSSVSKSGAN